MRAAESFDVVIVGGGPAGLAAAIVAAERGCSTLVLEQRETPPDKACGEGLLPPAVRALDRLGALRGIDPCARRSFSGIRFVQEDGVHAEAPFPADPGLGVRRTVLVGALLERAQRVGAHVRHRAPVVGLERGGGRARVLTADGPIDAALVVAADGIHSPIRRAAGLDLPAANRPRYALRRHFRIRPWTDFVEVHVDRLGEAVVTPVSPESVNVNFVWERGTIARPSIEALCERFPALRARLEGAATLSDVRGAGPMGVRARRRVAERLVLLGDAAGFVDSIAADGLSIAFSSALLLGRALPAILARGATRESLADYDRAAGRLFRRYAAVTQALLWIARHPPVRRPLVRGLARHPAAFRSLMGGAMRLMLSTVPA